MNLSKLYTVSLLCLLTIGLSASVVLAQTTVTGVITAANDKMPIPGANVTVKGTTTGTITDFDGKYSLSVTKGQTLQFSFIGYAIKEIVYNGETTLNVELNQNDKMLADVVVVGYGTVKKSDLTGAVSQIEADDLAKVANVDPLQKMQGRVAGVNIVSTSGEPGKGAQVRIRGVGTINNSNPIYVVDGFITNDISNVPPEDIKSMEVLKDAAATAIYGSRGANGVVLITTHTGKEGKLEVSASASFAMQQVAQELPVANAWQYATLLQEAYANDNASPSLQDQAVLNYAIANKSEGTNWQDEIFRDAGIQNYSISIKGGSAKNQFLFSSNYFNQEGVVKNSGMEKLFLHLNNRYQLNDKVEFSGDLSFTTYEKNNHNDDPYNGAIPTALRIDPLTMAWDEAKDDYGLRFMSGVVYPNPARVLDESKYNKSSRDRFIGNFALKIKDLFTEGLSFTSRAVGDFGFNKSHSYLPEYFQTTVMRRDRSQYSEERKKSFNYQWSNFLNYNKTINKHSITAMAGVEVQEFNYNDMYVQVYDVPADPSLHYIGQSTNVEDTNRRGGATQTRLASAFARAFYTYDNRYMFNAVFRADGSSKFIGDNIWGYFPAFSLGWNVAEEAFMDNVYWLDGLKLRASWGQVGNEGSVAAYQYLSTVNRTEYNYSFGPESNVAYGSVPVVIANPALQWEVSEQTNVGADFTFLKSRLSITTEYFVRKTNKMLLAVPIPLYAGAGRPTTNAASMENKGFEFALGWNDKIGSDFSYDINFNMSFIGNEITGLGGAQPISGGSIPKMGAVTRTEEGYEIAYFYGQKTDGVFNTEEELNAHVDKDGEPLQPSAKLGDLKFVDNNKDGKIDEKDKTYLGSATPDFSGGLKLGAQYKGFDLSAFFNFSYGAEIVNGLKRFSMASDALSNWSSDKMNRWTPENSSSEEPRMTLSDANKNSATFTDRYVEDGSYLKLKNLQLGYTLNTNKGIAARIGLKSARVFVSADNVFTLTEYSGWDPEVGGYNSGSSTSPLASGIDFVNYPLARIYNVGVNLKF